MMPAAIAKLRRTFIAIAMASFFVVIAFMGGSVTIANIVVIMGDANRTIDAILDAHGATPSRENYIDDTFFEEATLGLRFFTVTFDDRGEIVEVDLSHVASIDRQNALELAELASDPRTLTPIGRHGYYIYKEGPMGNGSMVVFLDCSIQIANAYATLRNTLIICIGALIVTFLVVFVLSKRVIRHEVENARQQQQFMTNAGHELKTPIAVIRANTELTEMMSGETEWTQSTLRQVDRLEGLVGDLMTIVRGEERAQAEADEGRGLAEIDVAAVVRQAVDSFNAMAQQQGKTLNSSLAEGATVRGNAASIEQLTCLLMDNAMKYCDEGGTVSVRLTKALIGRGCTLAVSNDFAAGANVDYRRFFERFYRADEAHENQQGYGIGLSVAESICERYHGSIKASWKAGVITFTCVLKDA